MSHSWLSAEIAVRLGVTEDTVYVSIADRGMPAHKVRRLWQFQGAAVNEWLRTDQGNTLTKVTGS